MQKIVIAVHGGAGPDSDFIKEHLEEYKQGIKDAVNAGYEVLENKGTAVDAVEAAVRSLEDNYLFNAGKGSALKENATIEMCSSIMDGSNEKCGAIGIVKNAKNPITLARVIMEKSSHIYLGETGGEKFAKELGIEMEPDAYFITDHAYEQYKQKKEEEEQKKQPEPVPMHGTVGAVALDSYGNIAAATSTGGTENAKEGRIGDTSMIGCGTYANNKTCAVSATGDGEYNIRFVTGFHVAAITEYKKLGLKEACDFLIFEQAKDVEGDMGLIAINRQGEIAMAFNSDRMHRGWKTSNNEEGAEIY